MGHADPCARRHAVAHRRRVPHSVYGPEPAFARDSGLSCRRRGAGAGLRTRRGDHAADRHPPHLRRAGHLSASYLRAGRFRDAERRLEAGPAGRPGILRPPPGGRPAALSTSAETPGTMRTAGWIRVYAIDEDMALATITYGCDGMQVGDYLEPLALPAPLKALPREGKPEAQLRAGDARQRPAHRVRPGRLPGDRSRVGAGHHRRRAFRDLSLEEEGAGKLPRRDRRRRWPWTCRATRPRCR